MNKSKALFIAKNIAFDLAIACILWLLVKNDVIPFVAAVVLFAGAVPSTVIAMISRKSKAATDKTLD